ncbi:hypothetical protein SY212_15660 [Ligilactobacillus agilis]|uniref:Uncharacterized protein n=1 Tax=Ligilactobacillus agilis TaxID=1601 RepID=A0A6F9YLG8_9LACO|nr:hypothetical protein [Ligilactobacillus agilis]GET06536.1 hypothetical protein SY212_15660 [Ligilactobacillus agilis]GET18389.1 hypothetical protein PTL465_07070 [Ligilactobacillus agilis]
MGERTQLLVRLHDEDGKTRFSTVLHYQWGFGRVMLMDTLNLVAQIPAAYHLNLESAFGKGYEEAYYRWFGQKSSGDNYVGVAIEKFEEYGISKEFAYHATEDDLWKCDNNDGFIILDLFKGPAYYGFERSIVSFFANDWESSSYSVKQVSFEDYCNQSDGNEYTTDNFRASWKLLAEEYGIELVEPKTVIRLGKGESNYE